MFSGVFLITKRIPRRHIFVMGMGRLRKMPVPGITYNQKRACMAGRLRVMTAGIEEPATQHTSAWRLKPCASTQRPGVGGGSRVETV